MTVNAAYGPWLTAAKVQAAAFSNTPTVPNDGAVLFKRGTVMSGGFTLQNLGSLRLTLGAYGTGAQPILRYNGAAPTAQSAVIYFNNFGGGGVTIRNLTIDGNLVTDAGPVYVAGVASAVGLGYSLINCSVINCNGNGVQLSGGASSSNTLTNVFVTSCCKVQSNGAGIDGGAPEAGPSAQNVNISYCTVDSCGNGGTSHNMYVSVTSNSSVHNNWSKNSAGNQALVMHGLCDSVLVYDNKFENGQNGLAITNGGYGSAEGFSNFIVERNLINGGATGIALEGITDSVVRDNVVNGATVYGAYLLTSGTAPTHIPYPARVKFYNNTIYCASGSVALRLNGANWTSIEFRNNILYGLDIATTLIERTAATDPNTFTLDNNQYFAPNKANGQVILWDATAYTLAGFQAAVTNKEQAGQYGDPLFVTTGSNFALQAGSPCKLKAAPLGVTYDFVGTTRSVTTPSIGAYE